MNARPCLRLPRSYATRSSGPCDRKLLSTWPPQRSQCRPMPPAATQQFCRLPAGTQPLLDATRTYLETFDVGRNNPSMSVENGRRQGRRTSGERPTDAHRATAAGKPSTFIADALAGQWICAGSIWVTRAVLYDDRPQEMNECLRRPLFTMLALSRGARSPLLRCPA